MKFSTSIVSKCKRLSGVFVRVAIFRNGKVLELILDFYVRRHYNLLVFFFLIICNDLDSFQCESRSTNLKFIICFPINELFGNSRNSNLSNDCIHDRDICLEYQHFKSMQLYLFQIYQNKCK